MGEPVAKKILNSWSQQQRRKYQIIHAVIVDSTAPSNFGRIEDIFESTGEKSEKLLAMPNEQREEAIHKAMLPKTQLTVNTQKIDNLPSLKSNSLISVCKLADAGVFHAKDREVTVYWDKDIAIKVSREAVLQGWEDENRLWHVPLVDKVVNVNNDTLLID